jgi:hypothetical protein
MWGLKSLGKLAAAVIAALSLAGTAVAQAPLSEIVVSGKISGRDHQTYIEAPFDVPAGVERLTIELEYTGRLERTVIDLGVRDPHGFRGWSGGSKKVITIASSDATPSYAPGPIQPGTWRLILGVPNIRSHAEATYTARITFGRIGEPSAQSTFFEGALQDGPGWYRGDFHTHTGHSDGFCNSLSARRRVPCPAFRTLEAARRANLDFVAVTEHNAVSHHSALRELQAYYDTLLIIPGREITTFYGHMNAIGPTGPLDFQLGSPRLRTLDSLLDHVTLQGGILSINHPGMPSGEDCMGCGFVVPNVDYRRVHAVEIANGGTMHLVRSAEGRFSHIPFWEKLLNQGHRITGIAGSDSHDPDAPATRQFPVGRPTTVVYARELSQSAILDGVRNGRVFVDLTGSGGSVDLNATGPAGEAPMGGVVSLSKGQSARLSINVRGAPSGRIEIVSGRNAPKLALSDNALDGSDSTRELVLPHAAKPYWIRVNVRDSANGLILISNPIYVRPNNNNVTITAQ